MMQFKARKNESVAAAAGMDSLSRKRFGGKLDQFLSFFPFISRNTKPLISVLRLEGVIGKVSNFRSGLTLEGLNPLIEKAFSNPKTVAVCLSINSPGGSPVQSDLIAGRIIALSKEKNIPVYSFVEDVAASGGYWLACAGDEIFASRSSVVGSIGVISSGFGFQDAISKLGIERRVYTQGANKSVLDPFMPQKQDDIKIIKKLQQEVYDHFVDYIRERRNGRITQDNDVIFNGEFWAGKTALDYGLIDGIDELYSFIKLRYGEDVKIDYVTPKTSWLKKKLGLSVNRITQSLASSLIQEINNKITFEKFNIK